jgi:large subunit ribosomal protein L6
VEGVTRGYRKELEIQGVGYRTQLEGAVLTLSLGFSHPIRFPVPQGIAVTVSDPTRVAVEGADKQQVGEVAARIRGFHKAEPYKGKGVRYKNEQVRRKAGKTVA